MIFKWLNLVGIGIALFFVGILFFLGREVSAVSGSTVANKEESSLKTETPKALLVSAEEKEKNILMTRILKARDENKIKDAIQLEKDLLAKYPNDPMGLVMLAEDYSWDGSFVMAEAQAKEAVRITPNSTYALRVLSEVYFRRSQLDADVTAKANFLNLAKIQIDKALEFGADEPWVNARAAQIYYALNDKSKAKIFIDKAVQIDPKDSNLLEIKKQVSK